MAEGQAELDVSALDQDASITSNMASMSVAFGGMFDDPPLSFFVDIDRNIHQLPEMKKRLA